MPVFVATETRRDGRYGVDFEAADWDEAKAICATRDWRLDGTLEVVIDAESGDVTYDRAEAERVVHCLLKRMA